MGHEEEVRMKSKLVHEEGGDAAGSVIVDFAEENDPTAAGTIANW